jgi:hypothetical protein
MHASGSPERWLADQVDPGRVARSFLNQRGLELLDSAATVGTGVAEGAGIVLASMVPFVGEAMDVDAALDPHAGRLTRLAATASLFGNLLTAGLAPNASAVTRAERRVADAVEAASRTPTVVAHPSQRAARRAALRQAGVPAGTPPSRRVPSRPGSQAASGPRGERTEWSPVSDGNVGVHHDPNGHLFPDGSTIPPHYGVDIPGGSTVHHVYPSPIDPRFNR